MVTLAFWNLRQKPLYDLVAGLCAEHDVDILVLAEHAQLSMETQIATLNEVGQQPYRQDRPELLQKLAFLVKQSAGKITPLEDEGSIGLYIRQVASVGMSDIILSSVHLPSKLHYSAELQLQTAIRATQLIQKTETRLGHRRTLIMGDFNMDPFDPGMVAPNGFNAVMDRNIAHRVSRTVLGQTCFYFYNPMWGRMGDSSLGPPGTYYYPKSDYYWHSFDQVLLRPELFGQFADLNFHVVSQIGSHSLLKNQKISPSFSDHLPIVLKLIDQE
jgi:hypothetical protein